MRQVQTDREDVQQLAEAAEEVERDIKGASVGWRGRVVSHTFSGSGSKALNHGLGRTPNEWTVVDIDAAVTPYRTAWDDKTITLAVGGGCSLKVRVV